MTDFVQNTLDGLMIGSSYGLLALGFTLIFGVMRRLNLSYGPSIMVGAYLGTFVYVQFGASPIAVAALAVAGAVLAGIYVERLCFAPMGGLFLVLVLKAYCTASTWSRQETVPTGKVTTAKRRPWR